METRIDRPKPVRDAELEAKTRLLAHSPFRSLDATGLAALAELGRLERLGKQQRLTEEGAPTRSLLVLGAGRVRLERRAGPHVLPLGHRGPGQTIGETTILGGPAAESAIVVDDVKALALPMVSVK